MGKLALMFSGQGSQYVGMGLDYKSQLFSQAKEILGYCTKDVLSDQEKLNQTLYQQPLVVLKSLLGFECLKDLMRYDGVCGFSLGEYSALYASGVFSFNDIMKLISTRANLMQEATLLHPGAMAAVIGLKQEEIERVCQSFGDDCVIANYNTASQFVISGDVSAVNKASDLLKNKGARRIVKLRVSGAFHSPMMSLVSHRYRKELDKFKAKKPQVPIYMNKTAKTLQLSYLFELMADQISHPVQFVKSIETMKKDGFTHFLEIGPGRTLTSFVKKIDPNLIVMNFDKYEQLDDVKGWLNTHGFTK